MNTINHLLAKLSLIVVALLALTETQSVGGITHYVNAASGSSTAPYTNWTGAATRIQDAINVSVAGDEVVVTNGVYQSGATSLYGMSNRVAVTKAIVVRSVNGPQVTSIVGYQVPGTTNGAAAVRCAYLANGAVLAGFTLTNGATQAAGDYYEQQSGGGLWCESISAVATNCFLSGNSAYYYGGGAYSGALNNCALSGNSAYYGGGAYSGTLTNCVLSGNSAYYGGGAYYGTLNNCTLSGNSADYDGGGAYWGTLNDCTLVRNSANNGGGACSGTLNNCTLSGNSASVEGGGADSAALINCTLSGNSAFSSGGGAFYCWLANCIIFYNTALDGNYSGGTLNYCCTTPLPTSGVGNFDAEPQLASASHLSAGSLCRGAGSAAYATGVDIDGEPWASPPSIGCDEYRVGSVIGSLSVAIVTGGTNVATGFAAQFQAVIDGQVSASSWDFGDGTTVSNRPFASYAWAAPGDFAVVLRAYNERYPAGIAASVLVHVAAQPVHYVSLTSPTPLWPYTNWANAATNIQDAVDAAGLPGALVLVSNGVYGSGAGVVFGMSNRVAVTKAIIVRSVNGPQATWIAGYQVPGTTNGTAAVRCAYLTNGAVLSGFTLTNGATQSAGDSYRQRSGGGLLCESSAAVAASCVLAPQQA